MRQLISLEGKRILVTQAADFMGPVFCRVFAELGAVVIADERALEPVSSMHWSPISPFRHRTPMRIWSPTMNGVTSSPIW